jgi:phosphoribosylaminoimidazole-succinocarboxamide synthase
LPKAVFDPTTKEEKHDRALTPEELIKEGFLTQKLFDEVKETATRLFMHGQETAANRGYHGAKPCSGGNVPWLHPMCSPASAAA